MPREVPAGNLPVLNIRCARSAGLGAVKLLRTLGKLNRIDWILGQCPLW
jgi:hypothetical protein